MYEEFRARFERLVEVMTYVVAPRLPSTTTSDIKIKLARLLRELDEYKIPSLRVWAASVHIFPDRRPEVYANVADEIASADSSNVHDGVSAVSVRVLSSPIDQCELDPETDSLLGLVSQQIKWRRKTGLSPSLGLMCMIVKERPGCIGETVLSDILVGLKHIIDESDPSNTEPSTDVADRLAYRKLAAGLAYRLFRYFSSQKKEIPEIVIAWKAICSSPSEFPEVRNEWVLQED